MNSLISANLIHRTLNFFKNKDFMFLEAPLLVDKDIFALTAPTVKKAKRHRDQYYVCNPQQSFYQLMKNGRDLNGNFLLILPCQRYESALDDTQLEIFLKIELISTIAPLLEIVTDFYCTVTDHPIYLVKDDEKEETNIYINGIEVGSYGSREYMGKRIYYGTGLALPRFIQAITNSQ